MNTRPALWTLCSFLAAACQAPGAVEPDRGSAARSPEGDPRQREVPLESASADWNAFLIHDNAPAGVWTVRALPLFEAYAVPEVVGLDDRGRCLVCVSYSGKWTPSAILEEGEWLGALAHGEVDARVPGAELYTGGKRGNLYQIRPYRDGLLDARRIASFPGRELHTVLAGDLDPRNPGAELLVFTRPGALFRVAPTGTDGTFETVLLEELPGRVRDALLLPARPGEPRQVATVTRAGRLQLLTIDANGARWRTLHEEAMGLGRLALAPARSTTGSVLYATLDDGRILRLERDALGVWSKETIHAGHQGPRGIAAGRFDADPAAETLAIFGYSGAVELLTRRRPGAAWEVETLFVDRDKGHWLSAAELDGRNGTEELIGSGYGARIFQLARPAGYGLERGARAVEGSEARRR